MKLFLPNHYASRTAPTEYRDAVEGWARQYGGHADIVWVDPPVNCWQIRLSLKPGDPRLKHADESTHLEPVLLQEWVDPRRDPTHPLVGRLERRDRRNRLLPSYVPLDLDDLGIQGILEVLDKGSVMSGRGEFKSAAHALEVVRQRHRGSSERRRAQARDDATRIARETRRQVFKIPFLPVGIDFSSSSNEVSP